uniref:HAUS augmin-like complex, subunit 4 n=1 Tax=Periophthalmus magnuspinnatus TaxID=409849 RepID=A0A3B3ZPN8_9GOBI
RGLRYNNEPGAVIEQLIIVFLALFPLCDLTEEDLSQNPQFCKLLVTLTKHVDSTGLTLSLKTELEKSQRRNWLRSQGLFQTLKEMIQEHCVRRHYSTVPPDQNFYETMEKCLLVAQCVRMLDPSNSTQKEQPNILGLEPQQILQLMPLEKNVQKMKQSLPHELEKHLKNKCLSLLCYYHPEWGMDLFELVTIWHLPKITLVCCTLIKCIKLLQTLILDHRLKIQTELDKKKLDYFEGKCELVLQKIKTEMVDIQLDTYTPDTISLKCCQEEKQGAEVKLASFEILGKEFQALAEEYGRLRQEIEMKNWALKEFTQYSNK